MSNAPQIFQTLIIYGICVPVAVMMGFLLPSLGNSSATMTTFGGFAIVAALICTPLILRFHYFLMLLVWNTGMVIFFLPGTPPAWMLAVVLSLTVSVASRTVKDGYRFLSAPQITLPLLFFLLVVVVTMQVNGGIGLNSFGAKMVGGKKYFFLLTGFLGYFALTAHPIPVRSAKLFVGAFFLGGSPRESGISSLSHPGGRAILFLLFPPSMTESGMESEIVRFTGVTTMCGAIFTYMLARYGVQGIFSSAKPLRIFFFVSVFVTSLFGGYRSFLIGYSLIFLALFVLEKGYKTKLLTLGLGLFLVGSPLVFTFASSMPRSIQRTLAFIPGVPIEANVRADADFSANWRVDMWKSLAPQLPSCFWMGKGYSFDSQVLVSDENLGQFHSSSSDADLLAISSNFHNGPLSVYMPFGIWGVLAFCWLAFTGAWALFRNYHYGNPELVTINRFFLAIYVVELFLFFFVFGALEAALPRFLGFLAMSVALNGGICKPDAAPATASVTRYILNIASKPIS